MKYAPGFAVCASFVLLLLGCNAIKQGNQRLFPDQLKPTAPDSAEVTSGTAGTLSPEKVVTNPPAKTIRFDGHEIVLGTANLTQTDPEQF
ncbi:MAG: hypothetical protein MI861_06350, partial [Pirellulales bacterium]|nr:hypothetical protein [Pirellulales bacterium]